MAKRRKIPKFDSEQEEREFWRTHDSEDFLDLARAQSAVFPSLKPSTRSISIRLPESLIAKLKVLANRRDVPYQSLLKIFLAERVDKEMQRS